MIPLVAAAFMAALLQAQGTAPPVSPDGPELDPHRRGSTIYVVGRASSDVTALSRDTGELLATIPVGSRPTAIDARRDGDRIYVACSGAHTVQILDGARRVVLDTIALSNGADPQDLVLAPDESTLYVAAAGRDSVLILESGSLLERAEVPVGRHPVRLALDRDGRRLYALAEGAGRVDVIDTASHEVTATWPIGPRPSDLALDPETGTLFVVRAEAPILHSIGWGAATPTEIGLEASATAIVVDAVRRRLAIASPASGSVQLLSPATGSPLKVIRAPGVMRLAIDPEGRYLYAAESLRNRVVVFDQITGATVREIEVGREPWDLVLIR